VVEGSNIRFKRGDVEFELSGSPSDVAKAWEALEGAVVAAFAEAAPIGKPSGRGDAGPSNRDRAPKKAAARRRISTGGRGGRAPSDTQQRLLDAKLDSFPELGKDPSALYVGYAVLRWARDELQIGELTAADVYEVAHKLGIPHVLNAYRNAFGRHPRAVHKTSKRPQTFELMNPGKDALDTYLRQVAAGGSASEAEAKAEEAEAKAKE
jgi:hypothetical protein